LIPRRMNMKTRGELEPEPSLDTGETKDSGVKKPKLKERETSGQSFLWSLYVIGSGNSRKTVFELIPPDEFPKSDEEALELLYDWCTKKGVRLGMPANAIKLAMISAGMGGRANVKGDLTQAFFVKPDPDDGELIEIFPDWRLPSPIDMRYDNARNPMSQGANKPVVIRVRPGLSNWQARLTFSYNASMISPQGIMELLDAAGYGVGLGDWRPEKKGDKGRFRIIYDENEIHIPNLKGRATKTQKRKAAKKTNG
jgi:hypothetical protein